MKIDGDEYLIMKESDIMGVLVEAKAEKKAACRALFTSAINSWGRHKGIAPTGERNGQF